MVVRVPLALIHGQERVAAVLDLELPAPLEQLLPAKFEFNGHAVLDTEPG